LAMQSRILSRERTPPSQEGGRTSPVGSLAAGASVPRNLDALRTHPALGHADSVSAKGSLS